MKLRCYRTRFIVAILSLPVTLPIVAFRSLSWIQVDIAEGAYNLMDKFFDWLEGGE